MKRPYRHFAARSGILGCCFLFVLSMARAGSAQDTTPDTTSTETPGQSVQNPLSPPAGRLTLRPNTVEPSRLWVPIGPAPVDQAGAGRRGYVLHGEDSEVTAPWTNRFSIHTVAANDFYREQTDEFLITQRYEVHTIALDFRRGFKPRGFNRFELGGQIQLHESDGGMLNGLILGLETFWASMTGYEKSRNELRGSDAKAPLPGTVISRNGSLLYRHAGGGAGIGDVYALAKVALLDADPAFRAPRVAARVGLNVAGSSPFTEGNYFGMGVSLDQKLSESVAFHGDVRTTRAFDRTSVWNLPLRRWTFAFSAGPEFKLPKSSSFNLQIDGSSTPYLPTGTLAFDKGYGAITFGLGHRFGPVIGQLYVRENMNLPFRVRWNTDPDLSIGIKVRLY